MMFKDKDTDKVVDLKFPLRSLGISDKLNADLVNPRLERDMK